MTLDERGGILGIYSSGVKMTLKATKAPMETTHSYQARTPASKDRFEQARSWSK